MKKTLILSTIILLSAGFLFASPSWIGVQGTGSYQQNTTTVLGVEQENTTTLAGLNIAGTVYPGEAPVGIGFQFGASKIFKATNDSTELAWEDFPLTWNVAAMAKYRAGMTKLVALELGAGLMYERTSTTYDFGSYTSQTNLNTLSVLTAADLIVHLSESLSLVGGVGVSFPITTKGTYEDNIGISFEEEFDVKGFTFVGKVGVAFGF
ncbi:MAG: hypothetical protein RBR15_09680 [Sphaerochaeta sp.]|nr:hypothetical protein [Sphaerochaeta sp.]